jgi:hypothetical protein
MKKEFPPETLFSSFSSVCFSAVSVSILSFLFFLPVVFFCF